eukprot:s412_g34.t1
MAKRVRECNVCGAAATKICSQCRCRHYCGQKCQRQDWRSHKQYCAKSTPREKSEEIEALKKLWLGPCPEDAELQNAWKDLLQKAGGDPMDPMNMDSVDLEKLEKLVTNAMKKLLPEELSDRDVVGYPMHVVKQLGLLPSLPLRHDEFVVSYSTFGQMDSSTGQLLYCIACMSNRTEQARAVGSCAGLPTASDCESVLFTAMIKPMPGTGDPMRPSHVLLANRWGAKTYEILQPFLMEHGIDVRLETEAEARRSAALNDVDPSGFNV